MGFCRGELSAHIQSSHPIPSPTPGYPYNLKLTYASLLGFMTSASMPTSFPGECVGGLLPNCPLSPFSSALLGRLITKTLICGLGCETSGVIEATNLRTLNHSESVNSFLDS